MTLTPDQINQLAQAIAKDYQNQPDAFANRLNKELGLDLNQFDDWRSDLESAIQRLIKWYNQPGLIGYLLGFFGESCTNHPEIAKLIGQITPQSVGQSGGGLEKIINKSPEPFIDAHLAAERRTKINSQVCQIIVNSKMEGTGFLVGSNLVLTNYHVVKSVIEEPERLRSTVRCKFDVGHLSKQATEIGLDTPWLVAWSAYAPAENENEEIDDDDPPTPDQLDYALIRLATSVGSDKHNNEPPRGWVKIPQTGPELMRQMALYIPQYPNGEALRYDEEKNAIDKKAGYWLIHNDLRLRYRVNTDNGSSGSPCFDLNYNLIALHHYGGTTNKNGKSLKFNQGIPIDKIRDRLKTTINWTQPEPQLRSDLDTFLGHQGKPNQPEPMPQPQPMPQPAPIPPAANLKDQFDAAMIKDDLTECFDIFDSFVKTLNGKAQKDGQKTLKQNQAANSGYLHDKSTGIINNDDYRQKKAIIYSNLEEFMDQH